MIYGEGLGLSKESDQLPKLIRQSIQKKAGVYLGKGLNRWSNVHIQDIVNLYVPAFGESSVRRDAFCGKWRRISINHCGGH